MITCRELIALLCDFIDGELAEDQRCLVEQHLGNCPPCVVYLETYRLTIHLTRKLPCEPLPEKLQEKLRAVLEQMRNQE
jgi:anti-sigma factor RsiW